MTDTWLPIATAPRDGSWFFTKSDPADWCPYDVARFDPALDGFVKAGCGYQYVTHWRPADVEPPPSTVKRTVASNQVIEPTVTGNAILLLGFVFGSLRQAAGKGWYEVIARDAAAAEMTIENVGTGNTFRVAVTQISGVE